MGQVYIPDINWLLLLLCIAVTAGFQNQNQIANAYGTAVVIVMLSTTLLMIPIMLLIWRSPLLLLLLFSLLSFLIEFTYFSSVLFKVDQGGWAPLAIAAAFLLVMAVWHHASLRRYQFELHSRVSMAWILSLGLVRVPGIGLVYTELASGVPHIFSHLVTNLPAVHSVVVFVCIKYLPVYTVVEEERFLVRRIGPKDLHMFRCVVRYGYKDLHRRDDHLENMLLNSVVEFVRSEENDLNLDLDLDLEEVVSECSGSFLGEVREVSMAEEVEMVKECREAGVVHILGNTVVRTRREARAYEKIAINYVYGFLRKICRENSVIFNIPQESLLNVGQVFYV